MDIQLQVSDYKSSNRTAVIGHSRDRVPITWQIGARRINHDREFCYRYDYARNCSPLGPILLHVVIIVIIIIININILINILININIIIIIIIIIIISYPSDTDLPLFYQIYNNYY